MWINGGWGWTPWMMIFPLFFLVLMVVFMVFMMRGGMGGAMGGGSHETPDSGETPREALDRRYARGEITREEYQQMRKDLE
ncbi:SHOCT domain-containing protein [Acidithiobacillus sp.]|uniref:SHOCT domain-containing protein n=1 Tax=Acidithiobacillus sp. TaxID=1872118 RepID=UPI0025BDFA9D|nr:SHOCT domain-containing protein [Acidithiobacillus sp.]